MTETARRIPGTEGYAETAADLVQRYEQVRFMDKYAALVHLLPRRPVSVLDIGAGSGADAAWLAGQGHRVLAVEPVEPLRLAGRALHPSPSIDWLDDSLPELVITRRRGQCFDLVLLSAVWMHLDAGQRQQAMPHVAELLRPGALLVLSLRHGPVPAGRRMFDVSADETIRLAAGSRLQALLHRRTASLQAANRRAGIGWTQLVFAAPGPVLSKPSP